MLLPLVDVIFADVAQPDQSRIVALNASLFLRKGGGVLISYAPFRLPSFAARPANKFYRIKANCIDSTAPPEQVFAQEVEKLKSEKFFPKEQLTLGTLADGHWA